jgi:UDP-N-acetylmuramate--alanine ligase
MCIEQFKKVYFLGIGGIGMSSIAQYLHKQGIEIFGYDASKTPLCEKLENEGIHIHYQPDPTLIPDDIDVFIYTPAIPAIFPSGKK